MMPARRAVWSGSPLATVPVRMRRSAAADMVISPVARASRRVAGFSPTSTIRALPRASRCDSLGRVALREGALATAGLALRQIERQAFERYREIHALELHVGRHGQGPGGEVQDRLDASRHDLI